MNPLTRPRTSGTLSPKGARVDYGNPSPRPLGGEGGERSEPGEGVPRMLPYIRDRTRHSQMERHFRLFIHYFAQYAKVRLAYKADFEVIPNTAHDMMLEASAPITAEKMFEWLKAKDLLGQGSQ